jgi:hypothetical protein
MVNSNESKYAMTLDDLLFLLPENSDKIKARF